MIVNAGTDLTTFPNHCILAFHNDTINALNAMVLDRLPGNLRVFHAEDSSDVKEADPDFANYLQSICKALHRWTTTITAYIEGWMLCYTIAQFVSKVGLL